MDMLDESTKAVINLLEDNQIYVVTKGKLHEIDLPKYGEVTFTFHDGKIKTLEKVKEREL